MTKVWQTQPVGPSISFSSVCFLEFSDVQIECSRCCLVRKVKCNLSLNRKCIYFQQCICQLLVLLAGKATWRCHVQGFINGQCVGVCVWMDLPTSRMCKDFSQWRSVQAAMLMNKQSLSLFTNAPLLVVTECISYRLPTYITKQIFLAMAD